MGVTNGDFPLFCQNNVYMLVYKRSAKEHGNNQLMAQWK